MMIDARVKALRDSARLLSAEGAWTKGALARDSSGEPTTVLSGDACQFCLQGVLMHTCWVDEEVLTEYMTTDYDVYYIGDGEDGLEVFSCAQRDVEDAINAKYGLLTLDQFNDRQGTSKEDVVRVLRAAANRVKREKPDEEEEE